MLTGVSMWVRSTVVFLKSRPLAVASHPYHNNNDNSYLYSGYMNKCCLMINYISS